MFKLPGFVLLQSAGDKVARRARRCSKSAWLIAILIAEFSAPAAYAQTSGSLAPVQSTLTTLVSTLTGPIATALATLAVISCGFLAWAGRLTWGVAGSVIFGIVLVFGAAQIVQFFQSAVGG